MGKVGFLLFVILAFTACDRSYHKFDKDFVDFKWPKDDHRNFEFEVPEDGLYDLTFELSHGYTYPFANLPLHFLIVAPDGAKQNFNIDIPISDANGRKIGECALDICDLNFNIKNGVNLIRGQYKIVISNAFSGAYVPDIIGIGLRVTHQ